MAPTTTTAPHEHHEGGGEGEEHGNQTPELGAFHDLLAPRWHAAQGPQRMQDTCGAIDQFRVATDALAKSTPPVPANADTWTNGTRALVAAMGELETTCKGKDVAKFDAAFTKVHEAFHALMAAGQTTGGGDMGGKGGGAEHEQHEHKH